MPIFVVKGLIPGQGTIAAATPFIFITLFGLVTDGQAMALALPSIQETINLKKSDAQWLLTVNYLATAAFAIPLGRLGDIMGYVPLMMILLILTAACQIGFIFTNNFIVMVIMRFLIGTFSSGVVSNRNIMYRVLPPHDGQHQFLQKSQIILYFVGLVTPIICGVLIQFTEYNNCVILSASCYIVSFLLLLLFTNPKNKRQKQKNDIFGSLLIISSVGLICLTFTLLSQAYYWQAALSFIISIASTFLFYFVEKRHINAIIPIFLMKSPVTDIVLVIMNSFVVSSALGYIMPQYLGILSIKSAMTSLLFTISGFGAFVISLCIPMLQKKFFNRDILIFFHIGSILSTIFLFFFSNNTIALMILFAVLQIFLFGISLIIFPLAMMSAPRRFSGQIGAIPTSARTIGQSLSYCYMITAMITARTVGSSLAYCIFSMIQSLVYDNYKIQDEVKRQLFGYQIGFIFFVPFLLINILLIWFRVGLQSNEINKKGFNESKVRKLQVSEDDIVEKTNNVNIVKDEQNETTSTMTQDDVKFIRAAVL